MRVSTSLLILGAFCASCSGGKSDPCAASRRFGYQPVAIAAGQQDVVVSGLLYDIAYYGASCSSTALSSRALVSRIDLATLASQSIFGPAPYSPAAIDEGSGKTLWVTTSGVEVLDLATMGISTVSVVGTVSNGVLLSNGAFAFARQSGAQAYVTTLLPETLVLSDHALPISVFALAQSGPHLFAAGLSTALALDLSTANYSVQRTLTLPGLTNDLIATGDGLFGVSSLGGITYEINIPAGTFIGSAGTGGASSIASLRTPHRAFAYSEDDAVLPFDTPQIALGYLVDTSAGTTTTVSEPYFADPAAISGGLIVAGITDGIFVSGATGAQQHAATLAGTLGVALPGDRVLLVRTVIWPTSAPAEVPNAFSIVDSTLSSTGTGALSLPP